MPRHSSCMTERVAVAGIDAGAAELEDLAGIGEQRRDVVFVGRVELAALRRRRRGGSADRCRPPRRGRGRRAVVDDQQMIAIFVEAVEVAPRALPSPASGAAAISS